jgi:hypothetical protein
MSRRRGIQRVAALGLFVGVLLAARSSRGHDLNSASLSLREVDDGRFVVRWQASSLTLQQELATPAAYPSSCVFTQPYLACGREGLVGTLSFPWLEGSETTLMVDIEWQTGTRLLRVVNGRTPSMVVYGIPAAAGLRSLKPIVLDYTRLGVEHILTGFDHLLFVVALVLLIAKGRRLLAAITAFTLAHSLTLACATLGLLHVPPAPVEAAIALSVVFVCRECLRPDDALSRRFPWVVAFTFGLLHGLGFASSLLAIGLPERHVPVALLFFNVGVELGQLGVIVPLFVLRSLVPRLRGGQGVIYAMGATAAYWTVGRIVALFAAG